ncbi:hypothetical protein F4819DRAFT_92832 [Hypoxylon fuscum]|nr:hypothetical protein F4819DRAFT_92832 [Hypoxylon fuscum]
MASLTNFPNEILIEILEVLATVDLQTLIILQFTNRTLRTLALDVIHNTSTSSHMEDGEEMQIHPLWKAKFRGIFNTMDYFMDDCFTAAQKRTTPIPIIVSDHMHPYIHPFCRLPWAQVESERSAYIRPEASWKTINLTFGQPPIMHLDVVKCYFAIEARTVDHYQLELEPPGLTMGLFYDILLCETATYGRETGCWELIPGRRLPSSAIKSKYECFVPDDSDLVDFSEEARQAAILYVRGGPIYGFPPEPESWVVSSQTKERLLPWQGPIRNIILTGAID